MKLMLDLPVKVSSNKIGYKDKILLTGSCFTEEIGNKLKELKFNVLQNPNGILYDPLSISKSILSYLDNKQFHKKDIFFLNELWHSWQHHSKFSGKDAEDVLREINNSQAIAHSFLKEANWIIITVGSSFYYKLSEKGESVSNCHKAPAANFIKNFLKTCETVDALRNSITLLRTVNPGANIIFTVSPVKHIKDGLVENNRSKARLLEAVQQIAEEMENVFYFPAYELVTDVLRDHRFYKEDLVHPNEQAIEFVFEHFVNTFVSGEDKKLLEDLKQITTAAKHRVFSGETALHATFKKVQLEKIKMIQRQHPHIDLENELQYFS